MLPTFYALTKFVADGVRRCAATCNI